MRWLTIMPLACVLAGCLAPGTSDPTRYPWDPRNKPAALAPAPHPRIEARGLVSPNPAWQQPQAVPITSENSYCVMAIEQESKTGITAGGNANVMACSVPSNSGPANPPSKPH